MATACGRGLVTTVLVHMEKHVKRQTVTRPASRLHHKRRLILRNGPMWRVSRTFARATGCSREPDRIEAKPDRIEARPGSKVSPDRDRDRVATRPHCRSSGCLFRCFSAPCACAVCLCLPNPKSPFTRQATQGICPCVAPSELGNAVWPMHPKAAENLGRERHRACTC